MRIVSHREHRSAGPPPCGHRHLPKHDSLLPTRLGKCGAPGDPAADPAGAAASGRPSRQRGPAQGGTEQAMNLATTVDALAVADDLRRRVEGEVLCDEVHRTLYSTAACIYQVRPLGAVVPRHEADVLAVVEYARRNGLPITARGGGSGLAGQTLGRGLILDFSKHFKRVTDLDPKAGTARVQPGVVQAQLNRILRRSRMQFGPDPSSSAFCTLGGMLANNAGGSHTVRHGATRDNVLSLRVALASGEVIETVPWGRRDLEGGASGADPHRALAAGLARIGDRHRALIEKRQPTTRRNSSGYALRESTGERVDLAPLLVGSEGTLGLILDATLKILPIARERATALLLFDDLQKAGAAVMEVLKATPSAVELLDRTFIDVIREADERLAGSMPTRTEALLILELEGDETLEVPGRMAGLTSRLTGRAALATEVRRALRPEEAAKIWAVRKAASPILSRREGKLRNTRFIEDAAVRPEQIPEFVGRLPALLAKYELTAAIFGHAGDCNLHCNPLMSQTDPRDLRKMEAVADEFVDLVIGLGGSPFGEPVGGRLRTPYLRRAYGPLVDVFAEGKQLFDPAGALQPRHHLVDCVRPLAGD